jgi:hypothetical protein
VKVGGYRFGTIRLPAIRIKGLNKNYKCYNFCMSPEARRAIIALERNVKTNTPKVLKKLRQAGVKKPNPALVYTAAKYYECLDRLAKEDNE